MQHALTERPQVVCVILINARHIEVKYPRGLNVFVRGSYVRGSREKARPVTIIILSLFIRQNYRTARQDARTRFIHAKHTGRDRQTAGVATNVSLDVTQLDLHDDDDESMQCELDRQFYAPSALRRAYKRFQLRDNDRRSINP